MLARALLPELHHEHPRAAFAITGSVARGDASAGSDLDLWCVTPDVRGRQRVHGTFRGVDVTVLYESRRVARGDETLARCEVLDALVLHDPRGDFSRVQSRARARAVRIWFNLCRATVHALRAENAESRRGPAWNRLPPLRESALRYAAAWVYARRGWRTPRWRTLQTVLPARAVKQLHRILGLPPAQQARRIVAALRRRPEPVNARLCAGEWEEAVLLARRHVERELFPRGRRRWERTPRTLRKVVETLHRQPSLEDVERTRAEVRALVETLKIRARFPLSLRSRLPRL